MSNFHERLAGMGARTIVQPRRLRAEDAVDITSADGTASMPTVAELMCKTHEELSEMHAASSMRIAELQSAIQQSAAAKAIGAPSVSYRQHDAMRRAKVWHGAHAQLIQTALGAKRRERAEAARANGRDVSVAAKAAAHVARRDKAERRFVEAAKRLLSAEQYELLWDEAFAQASDEGAAAQ